jgi:hypothetical protein
MAQPQRSGLIAAEIVRSVNQHLCQLCHDNNIVDYREAGKVGSADPFGSVGTVLTGYGDMCSNLTRFWV